MIRHSRPNGLGFMPPLLDVIILCGGAGLRLRNITGDGPKGLAEITGRPFLELLLRQLRRNGFQRAILAVGYRADAIQSHFGEQAFGLELVYAQEFSPLGTGGALRNAADLVKSDSVLVMNGDSYTGASLYDFVANHHQSKAQVSMIMVPVDGRDDCGTIALDDNCRVTRFSETGRGRRQLSQCGHLHPTAADFVRDPAGVQVSLERELFPRWLGENREIRALIWPGPAWISVLPSVTGTRRSFWVAPKHPTLCRNGQIDVERVCHRGSRIYRGSSGKAVY